MHHSRPLPLNFKGHEQDCVCVCVCLGVGGGGGGGKKPCILQYSMI